VLDRYQAILETLGVKIRHNTAIGSSLTIPDLFRDGYDAVFVGTGTWRAQTLGVSGEAGGNVLFGLDYLMSPETAEIGERVAVIGAGNTAMDGARTAFRQGAREVTLYARSKHVSASSDELEYALLDGCELLQGKAICEINERGPVFKTAIFDEDDRVVGYEEELDQVECDTVIVAVSQKPKNKLILTTEGLEGDERGLLIVDEHGMCTVPGVFAAGDVVTGPNTVVHAVAATKVAVKGMLDYMGNN
jgi:glutamate synthase (NADPH/NADH) small chain